MTHTTSPQPQPSLSQSPTSGSCNQAGSPDSPLPPRISAVLNTYNAAEHLDEVLDALHGFDEIILVDMHSTDETRAIATRHGARIIDFERCGICEPARNAAIQAASNPWVLIVDADEIVPPPFAITSTNSYPHQIHRPHCASPCATTLWGAKCTASIPTT